MAGLTNAGGCHDIAALAAPSAPAESKCGIGMSFEYTAAQNALKIKEIDPCVQNAFRCGDMLLAVDGVDVKQNPFIAAPMIWGLHGTFTTLAVSRNGHELKGIVYRRSTALDHNVIVMKDGQKLCGVGLVLEKDVASQFFFIKRLAEGSPAHASDLDVFDLIMSIDGVDLRSKEKGDLPSIVLGPEGSILNAVYRSHKDNSVKQIMLFRSMETARNQTQASQASQALQGHLKPPQQPDSADSCVSIHSMETEEKVMQVQHMSRSSTVVAADNESQGDCYSPQSEEEVESSEASSHEHSTEEQTWILAAEPEAATPACTPQTALLEPMIAGSRKYVGTSAAHQSSAQHNSQPAAEANARPTPPRMVENDKVSVMLSRTQGSQAVVIDKRKFSVPSTLSMAQFAKIISHRLGLGTNDALLFGYRGLLGLPTDKTLAAEHINHQAPDGLLYLEYDVIKGKEKLEMLRKTSSLGPQHPAPGRVEKHGSMPNLGSKNLFGVDAATSPCKATVEHSAVHSQDQNTKP